MLAGHHGQSDSSRAQLRSWSQVKLDSELKAESAMLDGALGRAGGHATAAEQLTASSSLRRELNKTE